MNSFLEIICIGNELLIGKTLNTNARWLGRRITSLGLKVKRITVVRDEIDEIAQATKEAVQRKPCFIITTGGLGPTFDDKTLQGVAVGLELSLEENQEAMEMIRKTYRSYVSDGRIKRFEMTPHRIKMGVLPKGATPLRNIAGTAPGVILEHEGVNLVMLPGVPNEMMSIFDKSVAPLLGSIAEDLTFFEASLDVRGVPESELAPAIDQVISDNPSVYIKSHPQVADGIPRLELHLSTTSKDSKLARQRIGRAIIQISEMSRERGGKIRTLRKILDES